MQPSPSTIRPSPPRARWWQRLFLVVVFPLLLLGAVELLLRLVGYGPDTRFVVTRLARNDRTRIMGINPEAYQRFHFRDLGLDPERTWFARWREFIAPKRPGTCRIFFLGGSTVEGYPHPRNACAPAFLEVLLDAVSPVDNVEVVNCGVTAINSFSLREWTPAVLRYEPDALVVYAGHNEFYGAYGAGSLSSIGTNRSLVLAHLAVRRLRLAQFLTNAADGVAALLRKRRGGLMELLAKDRAIPLDDPRYAACRENFRANLVDIVRAARARNVPVYLCGLVSNERDLVPFVSLRKGDLSEGETPLFDELVSAGMNDIGLQSWRRARLVFEEALRMDDRYAEVVYRLAQCHDRLGDAETAKKLYERARDLDGLRFRATAEFTETIRAVCDAEGAVYVDVPAAFDDAAEPRGLIGWDLMTDHLHPNERGHYLLARAVAREIVARDQARFPAAEDVPAYDEAAARLGLDEIDALMWKIRVYLLAQRFPFAGTPNEAWSRRLESEVLPWQIGLTGPEKEAHEAWTSARTWDTFHYFLGEACRRHGEIDRALRFYRAAYDRSEPHGLPAARARVGAARSAAALRTDDAPAALAATLGYLDECLAMHPDDRAELRALRAEVEALR